MARIYSTVNRNDQCPHCYELETDPPEVHTIVRNDEYGIPEKLQRVEIRKCKVCGITWSRLSLNQTFDKEMDV